MSDATHHLTAEDEGTIEAATQWFVRSRAGLSRHDEGELMAWLRQAPEHVAALDLVSRAWDASEAVAHGAASAELQRARSLALTRASGAPQRARPRSRRPSGLWPTGAVLAASLASVAALTWVSFSSDTVYAARRGEQLSLALPDGTRVRLDSGTRLAVRFTPFRRRVELESGEAEFRIAHARWRPFRVEASSVEVWDRGTTFTVRRRDGDVRVVLLQGKVDLHDRASGRLRASLAPGQQAVLAGTTLQVERADLLAALAWREGQLALDDVSLSDAIAEFRARTPVEIALGDPKLGALRISGVYRIADPVGFLNALGALYPVRWREVAPGRYELLRAG